MCDPPRCDAQSENNYELLSSQHREDAPKEQELWGSPVKYLLVMSKSTSNYNIPFRNGLSSVK